MTMTSTKSKVGTVIRVEWNEQTDEVLMVMEITDPKFKKRVLHSKDFEDVITLSGKDVMVVASRSRDEKDNHF